MPCIVCVPRLRKFPLFLVSWWVVLYSPPKKKKNSCERKAKKIPYSCLWVKLRKFPPTLTHTHPPHPNFFMSLGSENSPYFFWVIVQKILSISCESLLKKFPHVSFESGLRKFSLISCESGLRKFQTPMCLGSLQFRLGIWNFLTF